ncbi:hypothetical protein ACG2F4_05735 [Halalkalibaculum sp. DA3122]|uniref:hypothetical protein n=1 Tax=unclassified Halalkalibaculum TaxID=2964617 RepID=UPI003754F085
MRQYPVKKIVISLGLGLLALWAMQYINSSDFSFNPSSQTTQTDSTVSQKQEVESQAKEFRNEDDWMGAYLAVQDKVREQLKDTGPVEFPWNSAVSIRRTGKKQTYRVESYAEYQTRSGDTVKAHFTASVHQTEDDVWKVSDLVIE